MNRTDLQNLANIRLAEATSLFASGYPNGAYYLAGYAVECALKSVIARRTQQHEFPDKQRAIESFVHDLVRLSRVAGLDQLLTSATRANPLLEQNWNFVKEWSPDSRYLQHDHSAAQSMLEAVEDQTNGVLSWIMQHW